MNAEASGTTVGTATATSADTTPARVVPAPPPPPPAHPTIVDPSIHERLLRDYKRLKSRLDVLEKENDGLRASLWELSWRYGRSAGQQGKGKGGKGKVTPIDDDDDDDEDAQLDPSQQPPLEPQPDASAFVRSPEAATLKLAIPSPPSHLDLTPTPTPRAIRPAVPTSTYASSLPSASRPSTPPGAPSFMLLNEPLTTATSSSSTTTTTSTSTTTLSSLPITPSSLAASLFPTQQAAPRPSSPSSTSSRSRTTPALRDASLKRDLDITLPTARQRSIEDRQTWKWGRGYDLKGHRGAIYAMKFSERELPQRGRLLATAGFDGVRIWGPKERGKGGDGGEGQQQPGEDKVGGGDEDEEDDDEEGDAWDVGDVDEIVHLTTHAAPVSDISFSPDMRHLLSGGYDSHVSVAPLAPSSSSSSRHNPVWTTATDGLVQAVSWINSPESQGDSGNLFAWGTSGKVLAVGDLRVDKPVMTVQTDAMINSLQSFRRSPHLLVGDSAGQIRHFSLRTGSFVAPAEAAAAAMLPPPFPPPSSSSSATTTTSSTPPTKKATPISCLALNGDWKGKREARWVASIGFDNFVRVYDRGMDPLRSSPKLVQTLKGKNRNWPIKAAWYQGRDYTDAPTTSRRTAASRTRSRSGSFTSSSERPHRSSSSYNTPHDSSSDSDTNTSNNTSSNSKTKSSRDKDPGPRPLSSSLLLAAGSSDPVVLLYDLSAGSSRVPGGGGGGNGGSLVQRLEGHKDSVYAVDFLQMGGAGEEGEGGYRGHGLLASGGADCVVKVWKPIFAEE